MLLMAPHAVRYCMTLMACALVALNGFRHSELVGNAVLAREETASHSHLRRRALTSSPSEFEEQVPVKTELMDHRLAILLPYLSLDIPPYLSLFCMGASAASSVADFVIPHNGILSDWHGRNDCPSNVIFIDLGTTDSMVDLMISRILNQKPEESWAIPRSRLVSLVSRHLESHSYSMVEYKGALGHIYQDSIPASKYSHWAYSDFDMLYGDLNRHISKDEWEDFDITTYGYGDQDRLFVRGQFTMHRNDPAEINQLWRPCSYLSDLDERFASIANGTPYKFESGEGCYSVALLQNENISVKYAVKAWSDVVKFNSEASPGIYLSRSSSSPDHHVLVRLNDRGIREEQQSANSVPMLPPDWFEYDSVYQDYTQDLHEPTSEMLPIESDDITDNCRLGWIQPEYRAKICVPPSVPVTNQTNLFWIRGKRYMQHFQLREFGKAPFYTSAPYFHFMSLKRNFRENQFAPVLDSSLQSIILTPQGGIPLLGPVEIEETTEDAPAVGGRLVSPLGVAMHDWGNCTTRKDCSVRTMLPDASYCFSGVTLPKRKYGIKCSDRVSWRNSDRVVLLSQGPEWKTVSIEEDVTLALTVQIEVAKSRDSLSQWVDLVLENLRHWVGAPSVVVIHLSVEAGTTSDHAIKSLRKAFSKHPLAKKALVAVVLSSPGVIVSRKALLNMAIDAAPTRWYLSGVEVERGLVISSSAKTEAYRAVQPKEDENQESRVFFIPQFGLNTSLLSTNVTIPNLTAAKGKDMMRRPSEFDKKCNRDENSTVLPTLDLPYQQWWGHYSFTSWLSQRSTGGLDSSLKGLLTDKDRLFDFEESPILLVDNQGPRQGVWTHSLVREVEEFSGRRCFNALRMAELAGLGYSFSVLHGAFAVSTPSTREVALFARDPSLHGYWKCEGCFLFNGKGSDMLDMLDEIASAEMNRPEKVRMLWNKADTSLSRA